MLHYCSEYFDTETGTVYLRARYYNPSIGRFISRDSYAGKASDPLSLNLYTYCANNPIVYVDTSGHNAIALENVFEKIAKEATKALGLAVSDGPLPGIGDTLAVTGIVYSAYKSGLLSKAYNTADSLAQSYLNSQKETPHSDFYKEAFLTPSSPISKGKYASWEFALPKTAVQDESITIAKNKTTIVPQKKDYMVYKLVDDNDIVQYIGRTNNESKTRNRHYNNPYRHDLQLRIIHDELTYEQCRGLEQHYINLYGTLNKYNPANNQINGISTRNKTKYEKYMRAANEYITKVK